MSSPRSKFKTIQAKKLLLQNFSNLDDAKQHFVKYADKSVRHKHQNSNIMEMLTSRIPDFKIVVDIFNGMVAEHREDTAHIEDTRKTSLPVLLGVLYRHQKRVRARLLRTEDAGTEVDAELSRQLAVLCARYWSHIDTTGNTIRSGVASAPRDSLLQVCEQNQAALATALSIREEDVIMVWVSELLSLEDSSVTTLDVAAPSISDHCTDFTITLDRAKSAVVVTLLGTRIFPNPSVYDVVMDLRAETQPFLGGVGHAGMVIGTRNLMRRSFSVLVDTVAAHPGYSVLVVGYSLGAGLAQLYTAQLLSDPDCRSRLPEDVSIRALCYGSPPVFRMSDGEQRTFPEIVIVNNDKDGIISASSKSVIDLFNKTVAIDAADLDLNVMFNMMMEKTSSDEDEDISDEDVNNSEDITEEDKHISLPLLNDLKNTIVNTVSSISTKVDEYRSSISVDPIFWTTVEDAIDNRKVPAHDELYLLGQSVLHMKNVHGDVQIRKFEGVSETSLLSQDIRLSKKMFDHHMPWGYTNLFKHQGESIELIDIANTQLSVFNDI